MSHLNLTVTSVLDAGRYACIAQSIAGSVRHEGLLRIGGETRIKRMPGRSALAEQPSTWLPCELVGDAPASVHWEKGKSPYIECISYT